MKININNPSDLYIPPEVRNTLYFYGAKMKKTDFNIFIDKNSSSLAKHDDCFNIVFISPDKESQMIKDNSYVIIKQGIFRIISLNSVYITIASSQEANREIESAMTFFSLHKFEIEVGKGIKDLDATDSEKLPDIKFLTAAFQDIILSSTNKLKEKAKALIERKNMFASCLATLEENMIDVRNELSRAKILEQADSKTKIIDIIASINSLVGKVIDSVVLEQDKMIITKKNIIFEIFEDSPNKKILSTEKFGDCYYYGDVSFSVSLPALSVKIVELKEFRALPGTKFSTKHLHPHISNELQPCLGNSQVEVEKYKKDFNLAGLIVYLAQIFNSYNFKSPYNMDFKQNCLKFSSTKEALKFGAENNNKEEGYQDDKFCIKMPVKRICKTPPVG